MIVTTTLRFVLREKLAAPAQRVIKEAKEQSRLLVLHEDYFRTGA